MTADLGDYRRTIRQSHGQPIFELTQNQLEILISRANRARVLPPAESRELQAVMIAAAQEYQRKRGYFHRDAQPADYWPRLIDAVVAANLEFQAGVTPDGD
jgi:hypothetical protein